MVSRVEVDREQKAKAIDGIEYFHFDSQIWENPGAIFESFLEISFVLLCL